MDNLGQCMGTLDISGVKIYAHVTEKWCKEYFKNNAHNWKADEEYLSNYAITLSFGTTGTTLSSALDITSGTNTMSSNKTVSSELIKSSEFVVVDSIPGYREVNNKSKIDKNKVQGAIAYANLDNAISTLDASTLSFGTTGKIKGVESIEFANGSVFNMPTISVVDSGQILVYLNGKLTWRDFNTIIKKENTMLNVKAVWGFTDYFTVFMIALLAIWIVKKASWRMFLTPVKKLFKFGEKKVKEAEEEFKKAEKTWKEIE